MVQKPMNMKIISLLLTTLSDLFKIISEEKKSAEPTVRDHLIKAGSQILFHPLLVSQFCINKQSLTTEHKNTKCRSQVISTSVSYSGGLG